jgi:hypothetical protein
MAASAAAIATAPTAQPTLPVHQDLAINLSSNRARKKGSRKELESALKSNHAELLSQQNLIDLQEKKIDSLHRRNHDLSNTVLESRANCKDAKRAASRAESNAADLLRQSEELVVDERVRERDRELAADERVREEVDIATQKAEVRPL